MTSSTTFAGLLEAFFTDRLVRQRQVSPHTIVSYRDTFRQLLRFAQDRLKKPPARMSLEDLDAPLIGAFLDHAEKARGLSARSRNVRLAAIRSFFRYVALEEPRRSAVVHRVLAMPNKKFEKRQVNYLTRPEVEALLAAPDRKRWSGRRDHALLVVAVQTGLRCSELAGLRIEDVDLGRGPQPALPRKRPEGTLHAPAQGDCRAPPHVAPRTPRPAFRSGLPQRAWRPPERRGHRVRGEEARHGRPRALCVVEPETCLSSLPSTHPRHGLATQRRGPFRHCTLARPRVARDDTDLLGSRHGSEGEGAVADRSLRYPSRTLSRP